MTPGRGLCRSTPADAGVAAAEEVAD
jgi:hypothetical protein